MKNKLGVYIGSFNPVHNGHISIVNYLIDGKYVDNILIVPTLGYWDKKNLVNINDRINMLKFFENDKIKIDTKNNGYEYTYELLDALSKEYTEYELYLIIGADNITRFNEWKKVDEILKYNIIVLKRGDIDINAYIDKYNFDKSKFTVIADFPVVDISSTSIRNKVTKENLDSRVYEYIKKNNLY